MPRAYACASFHLLLSVSGSLWLITKMKEIPTSKHMNTPSSTTVQRLWNYCNVLRDDGMSYSDYVEQLTYLLFLKMDQEGSAMLGLPSSIPEQFNWASLQRLDGDELEIHYRAILTGLGQGAGLIPVIFRKAQNKIQD